VPHPRRGFLNRESFHIDSPISGYGLFIGDPKLIREGQAGRDALIGGLSQGSTCQDCIFPSDAPVAKRIPAVGRSTNLQNQVFVIPQVLGKPLSYGGLRRQNPYTLSIIT
jgi:hypothetical protein